MTQFDEVRKVEGNLGIHTSYGWEVDPKRLVFTASRYKFVGKLLEGKESVLEVGCGDGFFSRIVLQHVKRLHAVDVNRAYIGSCYRNNPKGSRWRIWANDWDILEGPLRGFDAVYSLDVLEHIKPEFEDVFLGNLRKSAPVAVVGMPSLESQAYASEISRLEHVNCKTREDFRGAMRRHFSQVFMFGMNDEVVHTGMMPAYLFALGVNAT